MNEMRKQFREEKGEILKRLGRKTLICARCGQKSKSTHIHHLKELVFGGTNAPENLVPLCGDCHNEWDLYAETMDFGEFLTTLSTKVFAIMYQMSLFRLPSDWVPNFSNVYRVQFVSQAFKQDEPLEYFDELREENKVFATYPYSDAEKMLSLYGNHYKKADFKGCVEIADGWEGRLAAGRNME